MEQRFKTRESRPEDLERIHELEFQMVEKDALVKKTVEEVGVFQ